MRWSDRRPHAIAITPGRAELARRRSVETRGQGRHEEGRDLPGRDGPQNSLQGLSAHGAVPAKHQAEPARSRDPSRIGATCPINCDRSRRGAAPHQHPLAVAVSRAARTCERTRRTAERWRPTVTFCARKVVREALRCTAASVILGRDGPSLRGREEYRRAVGGRHGGIGSRRSGCGCPREKAAPISQARRADSRNRDAHLRSTQ